MLDDWSEDDYYPNEVTERQRHFQSKLIQTAWSTFDMLVSVSILLPRRRGLLKTFVCVRTAFFAIFCLP